MGKSREEMREKRMMAFAPQQEDEFFLKEAAKKGGYVQVLRGFEGEDQYVIARDPFRNIVFHLFTGIRPPAPQNLKPAHTTQTVHPKSKYWISDWKEKQLCLSLSETESFRQSSVVNRTEQVQTSRMKSQ